MRVLLVEPDYYTRYPPLGLLKLASYHRSRGSEVRLVHGCEDLYQFEPDKIEVTTLFTYAWRPVHEAIDFFQKKCGDVDMRAGGIYSSLLPHHLKSIFPNINVHKGLFNEAEMYLPAYDLLDDSKKWRDWDTSIIFTSRGCIRRCPFCVVPRIEGKLKTVITDVQQYLYPDYKKVTIWDNNFLASANWKKILNDLRDIGLIVDFNQGLDARLIDEEKAAMLADFKLPMIRMAYDTPDQKQSIEKAVEILSDQGIRRRNMSFYVLFNFFDPKGGSGDTPISFLDRIRSIADLGCVSYPMRYEPPDSLEKNYFISPFWTPEQLELVARARRVIGFGGAFPPYEGLVRKFDSAPSLEDAMSLRSVAV
jgi:hypothetical protein